MKYRLLDLLKDPTDGTRLSVRNATIRPTPCDLKLHEVKCARFCGLMNRPVAEANVTAADCTTCFSREIVEGELVSTSGNTYQIRRGIPRLLAKETATWVRKNQSSFSLEWKMFRFGERNWGQDIDYRKQLFLKGAGLTAQDLRSKILLDAGCGSGSLSMMIADSLGMEVIALDLASGIDKAYVHNTHPFVYFVQGSVLEPPIEDDSVDFLYCAGVLVHIPDAKAGFDALRPALKPGGRYLIWMYHPLDKRHHPNDLLKMSVYNWVRRRVTSRLPIEIQLALYLAAIPFYALKRGARNLIRGDHNVTTWREKVQDLTDMFSPMYQHRFPEEEIIKWFEHADFEHTKLAYQEQYGFAIRGDKPRRETKVKRATGDDEHDEHLIPLKGLTLPRVHYVATGLVRRPRARDNSPS